MGGGSENSPAKSASGGSRRGGGGSEWWDAGGGALGESAGADEGIGGCGVTGGMMMHGNKPCDAARAVAPTPCGKIAYDCAVGAPGPRASSANDCLDRDG